MNKQKPWTEKEAELIIVAPRNIVFNNEKLKFQGIESNPDKVRKIIRNVSYNWSIMRRIYAEKNPNFKQPIPYTVIRKGDQIFVYKRLSGGGESRLHDKLSIGAGGHMNERRQRSFRSIMKSNMWRELHEELDIKFDKEKSKIDTIGLINDDLEEVGKVHIGILNVLVLNDEAEVSVKEVEQLQGEWMTVEQLKQQEVYEKLESWSKYALDALIEGIK